MELKKEAVDCVISLGNQQLTGKNCFIKSVQLNFPSNLECYRTFGSEVVELPKRRDVEISIDLVCNSSDFILEFWDENYKPKIRNKKVDDCSIQELLFAVRQKI